MKKIFSFVLSIVMIMSIFAVSSQSFAAEYTPDSEAKSMLTLINNFRTGSDAWYWNKENTSKVQLNGLAALEYDVNLEAIAKVRAKELAESYSHTRPDGTLCFTCTTTDADGKTVETWGENIAKGTGLTYDGAFTLWCETEYKYEGQGHRRNMLSAENAYTCIGIAGFKADNGNTYWVQEFGYKLSAQQKSAPDASTPKTVTKKANTLKATAKTVKIKYKKLKKKAQTIKLKDAIKVSKAKGTVTYTKKSGNKKISINKKTGKITVKKGLKKGTYKVKITVKAAGNSSYKSKTTTVTVKIKVK